jgi:hypothetical protein
MQFRRSAVGAAALILLGLSLSAGAAGLDVDTPLRKAGQDPATGASYSAEESGSTVLVKVRLADTKEFSALVDYDAKTVTLKTAATENGVPAALLREEKQALKQLDESLADAPDRAGDALTSFISLLASAPVGATLDRAPRPDSPERLSNSLCEDVGQSHNARWDVDGKSRKRKVEVGPCYNRDNDCQGRCGAGCNASEVLGDGNPRAIQRFTQACLNHDMCDEATGDVLGECTDEFFAAADDFFHAKDCAAMSGPWVDGNGLTWHLKQNNDRKLGGYVDVPSCGRFDVTGHHRSGSHYLLRAKPKNQQAGCCSNISYEGTLANCDNSTFKADSNCDFVGNSTLDRRNPW